MQPTLRGLMVLVAATAVELATIRLYPSYLFSVSEFLGGSLEDQVWQISFCVTASSPFMLTVTLALPLCVFRTRPVRSTVRRPGIAMSVATALVFPATVVNTFLADFGSSGTLWKFLNNVLFHRLGEVNGLAIAAVWLVLALGRRWRQRSDAIDGVGRLLGIFWIGLAVLNLWLVRLVSYLS